MDESTFTDREKEIHDYAFKKGAKAGMGLAESVHKLASHQASLLSEQYSEILRLIKADNALRNLYKACDGFFTQPFSGDAIIDVAMDQARTVLGK